MTSIKKNFPWGLWLPFSITLICGGCKDVIFNNPLDPNASKETLKIIRVFDCPLAGNGDLAFDGEKLWKTSDIGGLTAFAQQNGSLIRTLISPPATGIAILDRQILMAGEKLGNTLMILDPLSAEVLNQVPTGDLYPGYLTSIGDDLIIYDLRSSGFFLYELSSGHSEYLFQIDGFKVVGLTMFRGSLLIAEQNSNSLFEFELNGSIQQSFSSPAPGIGGVTVDSQDMIFIYTLDGKIYQVSLP